MTRMRFKPVFTYDPREKKARLFRILWMRGVLDGKGYSAKLSVALQPRLWGFAREYFGWRVILCGIHVHFLKAYGGVIP